MSTVITLKNVRLSFPQIWTPKAYLEGQTPKFSCNLLLDKATQKDQIEALREAIKAAAMEAFQGKPPKGIKVCLGDGEEKAYDGYENAMFVSCSSRQRPVIVDRDRTPLVEEDGRPYAGCYVNAAVSLWVQNNQWGKRVNCNLNALQFVRDGESFGSGAVKPDAIFDDISKESAADVVAESAEDDFLS
jgi:hypothetical protein